MALKFNILWCGTPKTEQKQGTTGFVSMKGKINGSHQMHLRQKTVWSAHPMGKTGSKKSRSIKCFASTVTNQLFCPLASSLIHECVRAHAVILLWAGFNVLVQSGTAEGSHRSLLRGVFILTRLTERHINPKLATAALQCHILLSLLLCLCAHLNTVALLEKDIR